MSKSSKVRIGITMGDPSGIGPALISKALYRLKGAGEFFIIGDRYVFERAAGHRSQAASINFVDLNNVDRKNFEFGKVKAEYGRASVEYLDEALKLIRQKAIDCLVTAPISKEAVSKAGLKNFSGHTEYLAEKTAKKNFVMMLLNHKLKISLVTRHLPLKKISGRLNQENIAQTVLLSYKALKEFFLIRQPSIVVCGLNPHASDNGLLGQEELALIKPVLERLQKNITHLYGPKSADVAIKEAALGRYDCVIAMYHDQAMIPLKLLSPDSGVNLTLGLPFIRTSPLHGTAFDIAGNYRLINPASFIAATKLAIRLTLNQRRIK